jgi:NADPH:quinone reductase-like Zn-dependent oxidoreductase
MCEAIEAAKLQPVIGASFGFEQAKDAFAAMTSQTVVGKIVVDITK